MLDLPLRNNGDWVRDIKLPCSSSPGSSDNCASGTEVVSWSGGIVLLTAAWASVPCMDSMLGTALEVALIMSSSLGTALVLNSELGAALGGLEAV